MLGQPLLELDELERVGGRDERLGQERVGIEGDWSHERIELIGGQLFDLLGCRFGGRLLGSVLREERDLAVGEERDAAERQELAESRRNRFHDLSFDTASCEVTTRAKHIPRFL